MASTLISADNVKEKFQQASAKFIYLRDPWCDECIIHSAT